MEILDPEFLGIHASDRESLKRRFDELAKRDRIQFVTFHQSFSYEDFVEGLRADVDEETKQITYDVSDGIFKELCISASSKAIQQTTAPIDLHGREVWKMSLGNTLVGENDIYDECIKGSYILLGYGGRTDFSDCHTREDVITRFESAGETISDPKNDYRVTSVLSFVKKIKVGDLIVVSDGNLKFRAIGKVIGDYVFRPHPEKDEGYSQCRKVEWLKISGAGSWNYKKLMAKQFSQMTLYRLTGSIDKEKLAALVESQQSTGPAGPTDPDRYVLIIDEINRGNVSRIFGELITLIEPSKRAGAPESLQVKLPYSNDPFCVPSNVYLIGTMNTADRSLAGLDIALRRRFDFREMLPDPSLLKGVTINGIKTDELLAVMNQRIEVLLDREHCLGHAYFMPLKSDTRIELLAEIFRNKILPLLQEYFFEDWQRIRWVLNDHRKLKELQFVQQRHQDLQALFGGEVQPAARSDSWIINNKAFNQTEAYLGIIQSSTALAVENNSAESAA